MANKQTNKQTNKHFTSSTGWFTQWASGEKKNGCQVCLKNNGVYFSLLGSQRGILVNQREAMEHEPFTNDLPTEHDDFPC